MQPAPEPADQAGPQALDVARRCFWFKVVTRNLSRHTILGDMADALSQIDFIVRSQNVHSAALDPVSAWAATLLVPFRRPPTFRPQASSLIP